MKVTLTKKAIDMFKKTVDLLKESLEYVNLECKKTGLFVNTVNFSQTGIIQLFVDKDALEEYNQGNVPVLGLKMDSFQKMLKSISNAHTLEMSMKDNETLICQSKGKYSINTEYRLVEVDANSYDANVEYDVSATLDAKVLYSIVKDLSTLGDTVIIECVKDKLSFIVEGTDVAKTRVEIEDLDIQSEEDISLKFGLKDLLNYVKIYAIANDVELHLKANQPMCLHYTLKDDFGWFRCFLAPMQDE